MFKNYIFDLDGTILNTLTDIANAVNYAMEQMGYPSRTEAEVRSFIGNGSDMLIRRSVPKDTSDADCEKAREIYRKYYRSHLCVYTKPYDGIIEVLDTLKANGCRLAVVSNKLDISAKEIVKSVFGDRFEMVVGNSEAFPAKPAPDSVRYVMDTLGMDRSDSVYIGDSDIDVLTAHNSELPCIGVTWGNRDRSELLSAGVEYVVDRPIEILSVNK